MTPADLHPDAVLDRFPPIGWHTAEEFRRSHNPRWNALKLRLAFKQLVDEGRLETRVNEQEMVREYRSLSRG